MAKGSEESEGRSLSIYRREGLGGHLREHDGRERGVGGGLDDDSVARDDGGQQLVRRHRQREVPRRDCAGQARGA